MRPDGRLVLPMLGALLSPPVLPAQDGVSLRYAPAPGSVVRTLTEMHVRTTFTGFPALPDGSMLEEERRIDATQRVLDEAAGGRLTEVVVDAAWARRRVDDGPWRDVTDSSLVGRPARATLSPWFHITGIRTAGPTDGEVLRLLGAMIAGLDFAFPEPAVRPGTAFATGARFRVFLRAAPEAGLAVDETVFADLALTLDSVVRTEADELAYLSFGGEVQPRSSASESESGALVGTFAGAYAGRLVWSRGWNAFVSGVARIRVDGRIQAETPRGRVNGTAVWDTTIRHRVRP